MKTYHVGTYLSKNKKTCYLQTASNVDYLSCELYDYFGERETTKKQLKTNKDRFLQTLKENRPKVYGQCNKIVLV